MRKIGDKIQQAAFAILILGIIGVIIIGVAAESFTLCVTYIIAIVILFIFMYGLGEIIDLLNCIYIKLKEISKDIDKIKKEINTDRQNQEG